MGSSQHKSPQQARAFRRELDVVTSAEISLSRRTQRYRRVFERVRDVLISLYVSECENVRDMDESIVRPT